MSNHLYTILSSLAALLLVITFLGDTRLGEMGSDEYLENVQKHHGRASWDTWRMSKSGIACIGLTLCVVPSMYPGRCGKDSLCCGPNEDPVTGPDCANKVENPFH